MLGGAAVVGLVLLLADVSLGGILVLAVILAAYELQCEFARGSPAALRMADQAKGRAGIPSSSMMARTRSPMSSLIGRTCWTGRSLGSPTSQSR
jgi:hypothetical protein